MIQLLYISTATRDMDEADLAAIGEVANRRNARDGITGLLCFNGRNFMQWIEGERAAIDALMAKLQDDERHSGIVVMHDEPAGERAFPNWSMRVAFVSADDATRLGEMEELLPATLDADLRDIMLGYGSLR